MYPLSYQEKVKYILCRSENEGFFVEFGVPHEILEKYLLSKPVEKCVPGTPSILIKARK